MPRATEHQLVLLEYCSARAVKHRYFANIDSQTCIVDVVLLIMRDTPVMISVIVLVINMIVHFLTVHT